MQGDLFLAKRLLFIYAARCPGGMRRAHWSCQVAKEKWIIPCRRLTQYMPPSLLGRVFRGAPLQRNWSVWSAGCALAIAAKSVVTIGDEELQKGWGTLFLAFPQQPEHGWRNNPEATLLKGGVPATAQQGAPTAHAEQKAHQLPSGPQTWPVLTLNQVPQGQPPDRLSFS